LGAASANAGNVIYDLIGNSFYDSATGSVSGIDIFGFYLALYSALGDVTSMARDLATAQGSVRDPDFIFSVGALPKYELTLTVPAGSPTEPNLVLYGSGTSLNLDQVPKLSRKSFLMINMAGASPSLTQTAGINIGWVSVLGPGANVNLSSPANRISEFAANVANLSLNDAVTLEIGKVNDIKGATTSLSGVLTLSSIAGSVNEAADGTSAVVTGLLNVTANTGIDLVGHNNILAIGTNHTNSGSDVIKQH
jgi:hypothetical protein